MRVQSQERTTWVGCWQCTAAHGEAAAADKAYAGAQQHMATESADTEEQHKDDDEHTDSAMVCKEPLDTDSVRIVVVVVVAVAVDSSDELAVVVHPSADTHSGLVDMGSSSFAIIINFQTCQTRSSFYHVMQITSFRGLERLELQTSQHRDSVVVPLVAERERSDVFWGSRGLWNFQDRRQ